MLDPGETWTFTATRKAPYGPYANVVRASGQAAGTTVWDDDINYQLGVTPAVQVDKAVDALDPLHPTTIEDANTQPAKELLVGTTAVWTYLVTNTGNAAVTITSLTDDNGYAVDDPRRLPPDLRLGRHERQRPARSRRDLALQGHDDRAERPVPQHRHRRS